MNIVVVVDNNYAQYVGVMLTSMFENTADSKKLKVFVIYNELSDQNKINLREVVNKYHSQIIFINEQDDYKNYHEGSYVSKTAYLKINIPNYLSEKEEYALYLDGDIIINCDILEFEKFDIDAYYIAAVNDDNVYLASEVGKSIEQYFNSGVMKINLQKWREENISEKVYEYIISPMNKKNTVDQDPLNVILGDNWLKLNRAYNFMPVNHTSIKEPKLIHYAYKDKPWHTLYSGKYKEKFEYYKKLCSWDGYNQQDRDILENKELVIFGASTAGESAYKLLRNEEFDVAFFIDSDIKKVGTKICGKSIKIVEVLNNLSKQLAIIVPSISYYEEIKDILKRYDYTPMKTCNKIFLKN